MKFYALYEAILIAVGFVLGGIIGHFTQRLDLTIFWLCFLAVAYFIVNVIVWGIKRRKLM